MERYKIELPKEEDTIIRDTFITTEILPVCIKSVDNNMYAILFIATQDCTEEDKFIQILINANTPDDKKFLDNHGLNLNNIQKNPGRLEFYIESIKDLDPNDIYTCCFDMVINQEKKLYYKTSAGRIEDDKGHAGILDILVPRDNYIKLNLFFNRLMNFDPVAELVFMNRKLKNIEFVTIDHIKLDASATDASSNVVFNHYTCGRGPATFRFNFISPKISGKILRNPLLPDLYNTFYSRSYIINDLIYDTTEDKLIVLWEERSEINDQYKSTKALVLSKPFYDKTNLVDLSKIYN